MDVVEHDITLTCVSNEVGGNLVGAARWLGVPLQRRARPRRHRRTRPTRSSAPPSTASRSARPLEVALDGRNSMLAFGMNGEPLPREHGFPVRLVTPGLYGFVGATKWLREAHPDDVRRTRGLLDQAEVGHRRTDQALQPRRHPAPALHHRRRPDRHRRCRLGPARRGRQGRGPPRRGRLAGGRARPERGRGVLAPVVPALEGRRPAATRSPSAPPTARGETQTTARATPFPGGSSGVQQVVVTVA